MFLFTRCVKLQYLEIESKNALCRGILLSCLPCNVKFVSQLSLDNVSLLCTTYNFSIQLSCLLFDIQTKNSTFDDVLRMNFNVESILMRLLPYCLEYTRRPLIRSIMHLSFASPWFGSRDKKKHSSHLGLKGIQLMTNTLPFGGIINDTHDIISKFGIEMKQVG